MAWRGVAMHACMDSGLKEAYGARESRHNDFARILRRSIVAHTPSQEQNCTCIVRVVVYYVYRPCSCMHACQYVAMRMHQRLDGAGEETRRWRFPSSSSLPSCPATGCMHAQTRRVPSVKRKAPVGHAATRTRSPNPNTPEHCASPSLHIQRPIEPEMAIHISAVSSTQRRTFIIPPFLPADYTK
jgi:hypothetical protein